eukprot:377578-Rhodomonas_salina.3
MFQDFWNVGTPLACGCVGFCPPASVGIEIAWRRPASMQFRPGVHTFPIRRRLYNRAHLPV